MQSNTIKYHANQILLLASDYASIYEVDRHKDACKRFAELLYSLAQKYDDKVGQDGVTLEARKFLNVYFNGSPILKQPVHFAKNQTKKAPAVKKIKTKKNVNKPSRVATKAKKKLLKKRK